MTSERPDDLERLKRALGAIERLQARVDALERGANEPIAVVGLGCRFPGAEGPDAFWSTTSGIRRGTRRIPEG